jgi:glycogen(starch) synthase
VNGGPGPALPARVCVVTSSYPRHAGDAAGAFVAAHALAVAAAGARVEVIAAGAPGAARVDGPIAITRVPARPGLFFSGGAPDALEAGGARAALGAAVFAPRLLAACVAARGRHDAAIAHWLAPGALAAASLRGPLLAIAHGGDVHLLARLGLLPAALAALAARRARIAFVSGALRDLATAAAPAHARGWLRDHAEVIPMGVDGDRLGRLPRAPVLTPRPRVVVLARLVPIKGVDVALAALAHLPSPVELVIAGDGPQRAALDAAAVAAPARHVVTFMGQLDAPARDALLASAAVVVIPSRSLLSGRTEGMPQVALEALAAGAPLVVTRTGGLADLPPPVELAPPSDPPALAAALARALARPAAAADLRGITAGLAWSVIEPRLRHLWLAPRG